MSLTIPKPKPVKFPELAKAFWRVVPTASAVEEEEAVLRIQHRDGGTFTAQEQAAIQAVFDAHDADALTSADADKQAQVAAYLEEVVADFQAWENLTSAQKIATMRKLLRIMLFQLRRL